MTLLAQLRAHRPADGRERSSLAAALARLDRDPDPFDAEADAEHLTAAAIVLGPRGVLLHRHRRLGVWLQPGGHVDAGEAPWQAAVRETLEETGVRATHPDGRPALIHVDSHPGPRGHHHHDLRYLLAGDGEPDPAPGESREVAWVPPERALELADAGLRAALRRALSDVGPLPPGARRPPSPARRADGRGEASAR